MNDQDTKPTIETVLKEVRAGFASMDERLAALEAKAYDTKPIWQRALAEILEVKDRVVKLDRTIRTVNNRWLDFETELSDCNDRLDKIEKPVGLNEESR